MIRTLQATAVTLFFGVMMFFLFRDHVIPNWNRGGGIDVDRNILTDSWSNQDEWMEIRLDDMELGAMRSAAEWEEEGDYYTLTAHLQINASGLIKARVLTAARLNHRLELENVRMRAHVPPFGKAPLPPGQLDAEVLPDGAYEVLALARGQVLHLRIKSTAGGEEAASHHEIRLAHPVTMADTLMPIFRGRMLTEGVTYTIDVYDPLWGNKAGKVEIKYLGDEIQNVGGKAESVKMIELRMAGTRTLLWVDENGTVLRREIPLFASSTAGPAEEFRGSSLVLERLDPSNARKKYPDLKHAPAVREVTIEDVTGKDVGNPLKRLSVFNLLSGSLGPLGGQQD